MNDVELRSIGTPFTDHGADAPYIVRRTSSVPHPSVGGTVEAGTETPQSCSTHILVQLCARVTPASIHHTPSPIYRAFSSPRTISAYTPRPAGSSCAGDRHIRVVTFSCGLFRQWINGIRLWCTGSRGRTRFFTGSFEFLGWFLVIELMHLNF